MENPSIIAEDSQILVCDKPANLAVTKSQTSKLPTLQDWLANYLGLGNDLGPGERAGIVHRLDKQTSGVILVGKTLASFKFLQNQFAKRQVSKKYLTLVHNIPKTETFEVSLPIARHKFGRFAVKTFGKTSQTTFTLISKFEFGEKFAAICSNFPKRQQRYFESRARFYSLLAAVPTTGRTHQIRVHLKSTQLPIVADSLYLPRKLKNFDNQFCPRLFLHAQMITFTHPKTLKSVTFESKLPADLTAALLYLKKIA